VYVFASRDASDAEGARRLAEAVGARFVDRLSRRLEDLLLVAEFRILEPVVIVALAPPTTAGATAGAGAGGGLARRIIARIPRLVTPAELARDLDGLDHDPGLSRARSAVK
jgi:hypothetical protein